MEELKLAAVAQLDGFDLALIPHINSRNSLHIVGLKVGCNTACALRSTKVFRATLLGPPTPTLAVEDEAQHMLSMHWRAWHKTEVQWPGA